MDERKTIAAILTVAVASGMHGGCSPQAAVNFYAQILQLLPQDHPLNPTTTRPK